MARGGASKQERFDDLFKMVENDFELFESEYDSDTHQDDDEEVVTLIYAVDGKQDSFRHVVSQERINSVYRKLRGRYSAEKVTTATIGGIDYFMESFRDEMRDVKIGCYRESWGSHQLMTFVGERKDVSDLVAILDGQRISSLAA